MILGVAWGCWSKQFFTGESDDQLTVSKQQLTAPVKTRELVVITYFMMSPLHHDCKRMSNQQPNFVQIF